jgi:hypothetical protein
MRNSWEQERNDRERERERERERGRGYKEGKNLIRPAGGNE